MTASRMFDADNFARMIEYKRLCLGLSGRQAAFQIGISVATYSRVSRGLAPDIENYLRIKAWIEKRA